MSQKHRCLQIRQVANANELRVHLAWCLRLIQMVAAVNQATLPIRLRPAGQFAPNSAVGYLRCRRKTLDDRMQRWSTSSGSRNPMSSRKWWVVVAHLHAGC